MLVAHFSNYLLGYLYFHFSFFTNEFHYFIVYIFIWLIYNQYFGKFLPKN